MSTSKSKNASETESVAHQAAIELLNMRDEGEPSPETEARLAADEQSHSIEDITDIFTYCQKAFVEKGIGIKYYIKKDGETLPSEKHRKELTWDYFQQKYGGGSYQIKAKNLKVGVFCKQESQNMADIAGDTDNEGGASSNSNGFQFGASQSGGNDMSLVLTMMQQANERAEKRAEEQRERDEIRRREDEERRREDRERERDAAQRREDKNMEMLKLLFASLPTVVGVLKPAEKSNTLDPMVQLTIEQMKEQNRRLEDRLHAITTRPDPNMIDVKTMLDRENAARKEGRAEMEKIIDMSEERAETRAAEMVQAQGGKDETMTEALIKGIAPALGALLSRGIPNGVAPQAAEEPAALPVETSTHAVSTEVVTEAQSVTSTEQRQAPRPHQPIRPRKKLNPDEYARGKIMEELQPLFVDVMSKFAAGVRVTPEGAARESLEKLALKGFHKDKVLTLFTKEYLDAIVQANLPKEVHPWFNEYYAALTAFRGPSEPSQPVSNGSSPASVPNVDASGRNEG